jgi:rhodanese-related sulfurtransferase
MLVQNQDEYRRGFAYQAVVRAQKPSPSNDKTDFIFATIYKPRCLVNIYIPSKPNAEGMLTVFSDKEGFFTLDFKVKNQNNQLPPTIPEILRGAQFNSAAVSQSQFKQQKLNSLADRSYFSIVTLLTAGHSHRIQFSLEQFDDLIKRCPPNQTIDELIEDKNLPTKLSVAKIGNKLSSVSVNNKFEESVGAFDIPLDSIEGSWVASLTVLPKFNPNPEDKSNLEKLTMKLEKQKTIFSEQEIDKILDKIFLAIPKKTKLILSSKDTQIPMEWGEKGFQTLVLPEAIQAANSQRMVEARGWSRYYIAAGVLFICVLLVGFWKYKKSLFLIISISICPGMHSPVMAQFQDGPYCGLYCVKAAAAAMGRDVPFDQIRNEAFLSANPGSTTDDIQRALSLVGLKGILRPLISISQLCAANRPIILHTRSPGTKAFKHWALFLGWSGNDRVSIYDPPLPQREISLSELLAVWDGFGIEVADAKEKASASLPWDWLIAIFGISGSYMTFRLFISPWVSVICASLLFSFAWDPFSPKILSSPKARGIISANFFPHDFPEIDRESFVKLWKNQECSVVDARLYEGHIEMHIPDSYSLPINFGLGQLLEISNNVPKDCLLVCYCNNSGCGWADQVANQLVHLGFRNIAIYRGGMQDWIQHSLPVAQ